MALILCLCSILSLIIFAKYDSIRYPTLGKQNEEKYRSEQWKVQILIAIIFGAITFFTTKSIIITALVISNYFLLWWFWYADMLFYLFYKSTGEQEGFHYEVIEGRVNWAWWTVFGLIITLYRIMKNNYTWEEAKKVPISWNVLLIQLILGISYIVVLNYYIIKKLSSLWT